MGIEVTDKQCLCGKKISGQRRIYCSECAHVRRLQTTRKYNHKNRELINFKANELWKNDKEFKINAIIQHKKWAAEHPDTVRKLALKHAKKRYATPRGKLSACFSARVRESLQKGKEGRRWETLVGYSLDELKTHIEKQFKSGMTWENYGSVWHIDHIIPVSIFNFNTHDDIDFKRCWSLSNLQPLWAKENMSKHNKIFKPFQPSLAFAA